MNKKEEEITLNIKKINDLFKKIKLNHVILFIFLVLGLYLRIYHMDFPSIGYHNMKENEYLCEAKYYYDTNSDFLRRVLCINGMDAGPGYFEEYPQMPLIPWAIDIMWKLFGVQFWAARIIIILFSLSTIILMYLITLKLTKNEYLSLISSFLASIMPLNVFFGRNLQPETPALACLMLGMYFYLKWIDEFKTKQILWCGIAIMFTALFKYTFLIGLIPLLFIFPFRKIILKLNSKNERTKLIKQGALFLLPLIIPFIWIWITDKFLNVLAKNAVLSGTIGRVSLFRVFTQQYWQDFLPTINAYFKDNWTFWFLWFALIGGIILIFKYKTLISRFVMGYFLSLIPYAMILADYVKGHSYYQMPFVPLVCIASAYLIYLLGEIIAQIFKIKYLIYTPLLIFILIWPSVNHSIDVQYNTIFYGLDVAAEYLKEHTTANERFFVFGHSQSVGVCFNSDRKCGGAANLANFTFGEEYRNMTWVFIHGDVGMYELSKDKELMNYIFNNYQIAQLGLLRSGDQYIIQTYLLRKGGIFNITSMQSRPVTLSKVYDLKGGKINFYTVE